MAKFFSQVQYTGKYISVTDLGDTPIMPSGWSRAIYSLVVDTGYVLVLYDQTNLQPASNSYTFGAGSYPDLRRIIRAGSGNWAQVAQSYRLSKDCNNSRWLWDGDCYIPDGSKAVGDCSDKSSMCYKHRRETCASEGKMSDTCLKWCRDNGGCDDAMIRYCGLSENFDSDICSCINSKARKYNPYCVDGHCIAKGYVTDSMRQQCPAVTDCSVFYDLKNIGAGVNFSDSTIEQRCGSEKLTPQPQPQPTVMSDVLLWITLAILIILAVSVVFLVLSSFTAPGSNPFPRMTVK
jgi:hypothetical protein